jgi:hypothetical protein
MFGLNQAQSDSMTGCKQFGSELPATPEERLGATFYWNVVLFTETCRCIRLHGAKPKIFGV